MRGFRLPLSPPAYNQAEQDRTRRLIEQGLSGAATVPDGTITRRKYAAGSLPLTIFPADLRPVQIVDVLPPLPDASYPPGSLVFLTADGKLYRNVADSWTAAVATVDLTGTISTTQLADGAVTTVKLADASVTTAKIGNKQVTTAQIGDQAVTVTQIADSTITQVKMASGLTVPVIVSALPGLPDAGYPDGSLVSLTTNGKLYRNVGGTWTAAVPTTDLTGQVTSGQITDAAITTAKIAALAVDSTKLAAAAVSLTKFASGLRPVEIVPSLPAAGTQGRTVFLTTDNKLYRDTGAAWTVAVPTTDLSGQITNTQITDGSISTPKLAAGAVTAAKIAVNTITAAQIAANTITAAQIAADTITAGQIAAGAITASELAANAVTATAIAAGAITASKLAANAIVAGRLLVTDLTNLVQNPVFATGDNTSWAGAGAVTLSTDASVPTTNLPDVAYVLRVGGTGTFNDALSPYDNIAATDLFIPVVPGETYYVSVWAAKDAAFNGTFEIGMRFHKGASSYSWSMNPQVLSTTWAEYTTIVTVPASYYKGQFWMSVRSDATAGNAFMTLARLRKSIGTTYIENGAITTAKVSAGAITATQIAANTITAAQIAADTITAAQIAAGAIGASELAAGAVVAGKIAAGTIVAADIAAATITGAKIAASTITASNIAAGTITGDRIVAGTITAALLSITSLSAISANLGTVTLGTVGNAIIDATSGILKFTSLGGSEWMQLDVGQIAYHSGLTDAPGADFTLDFGSGGLVINPHLHNGATLGTLELATGVLLKADSGIQVTGGDLDTSGLGVAMIAPTGSTGTKVCSLGSNGIASIGTPGNPYKWVPIKLGDGSICWFPVWK